jgi:hypothetical protein
MYMQVYRYFVRGYICFIFVLGNLFYSIFILYMDDPGGLHSALLLLYEIIILFYEFYLEGWNMKKRVWKRKVWE